MKSNRDFLNDDLLRNSKSILEDFEKELLKLDSDLEAIPETDILDSNRILHRKMLDEFGLDTDGHVELAILKNNMAVSANMTPPKGRGKPLGRPDFEKCFQNLGVNYGIDWTHINKSIDTCNSIRVLLEDVIVAVGTQPIEEIPEHYVLDPAITESLEKLSNPKEPTKGQVDHKERQQYILVEKDQLVAKLVKKVFGKVGKDVFGNLIPHKVKPVQKMTPGKNLQRRNDDVFSGISGLFNIKNGLYWVNEVLILNEDIDYGTGHIKFPGDVILNGTVKDGFTLEIGGNFSCNKTLDLTNLKCGGDVSIQNGIIGKSNGVVIADGSLSCKFLENSIVNVQKDVNIGIEMMNSIVNTRGKLSMGKKGLIIGGKITATNGIDVYQVGSNRSLRTEIYCGIDYYIKERLVWIRDLNIKLHTQKNKIDENLKRIESGNDRESAAPLLKTREEIEFKIGKLNESLATAVRKLEGNQDAEVRIRGDVYPQTYIEICNISYVVKRRMHSVLFKLNVSDGSIQALPL